MNESDPRSDVHYLGSSENKYAKKVVPTLKEIYGSSQWHNFCFFFFCLPPDEQYTVELIQLTITLVNKREFIWSFLAGT